MIPIYTTIPELLSMHMSLPLCTEEEFENYKNIKREVCYITAQELTDNIESEIIEVDAGDHIRLAINYRSEEFPLMLAKVLEKWRYLCTE